MLYNDCYIRLFCHRSISLLLQVSFQRPLDLKIGEKKGVSTFRGNDLVSQLVSHHNATIIWNIVQKSRIDED